MELTKDEMLINAVEACNDTYKKESVSSQTSTLEFINSSTDTEIYNYIDQTNGFKANLYLNTYTGKYVVAFSGTNDRKDLISDIQMGINLLPDQFNNAAIFLSQLKDNDGNKIEISQIELITGHSLGGSIAQLIGSLEKYKNVNVVTLNAFGVEHLQSKMIEQNYKLSYNYSNIDNYIILGDIISTSTKHINGVSIINQNFINGIATFFFKHSGPLTWPFGELMAHNNILNNAKITFTSAQSAEVPKDPLLIDLDGDGIETTRVENGVYFDQENDGFAELSAWVSSDDGVLAIDKNNNGTIDNGSELFGDSYVKSDGTIATSGFDALSDLDSNGDGQINSSDTSFDAIKILKGDGTLLSLSDVGISSISLTSKKSVITDSNGNRQLTTGTYTKTDGSTGKISDYELQSDPMNSIATDWLEVSEEIAALPDIPGMGKMYSLHQAMARDEELTALIKTFINAPDASTRQS